MKHMNTTQSNPLEWLKLWENETSRTSNDLECSFYEYWSTVLNKRFRKIAKRMGRYIPPPKSSVFLGEVSKEVQIKRIQKQIKRYGENYIVRCTDREFCYAPLYAILREAKGDGVLTSEEMVTGSQWVGETEESQYILFHLQMYRPGSVTL
jgi:CRISPR/Cas system-associated endoribonuclease Cas2